MNIQKGFEKIYANGLKNFPNMEIDYWGVNIYSDKKFECKLYENNTNVESDSIGFIDKIRSCGVISRISYIENSAHTNTFRVDISLKNRTEHNMISLYDTLKSETALIENNMDEILKLSLMKVSKQPELKYASMYFVGFLYRNAVKAVKFHFITRNIDKNIFDNEYYLDYLSNVNIKEIEICRKYIQSYLERSGGNMWMTGVDYFDSAKTKYKVFIKDVSLEVLKYINEDIDLLKKVSNDSKERMHHEIEMFRRYLSINNNIHFSGIAVCCDSDENISFNFYCQGMIG